MQKSGVLVIGVLIFSLFLSGGVIAGDLNDCIDKCKANFLEEADRSPCIKECKGLYDFEDKKELECLPCGDRCAPYDFVVAAMCDAPTNGEPICGVENGECVVLKDDEGDFIDRRDGDCGDFDCDELELEVDAGTTPDSAFYFIDKFFDRFGDRIKVREEKIAEIKAMVKVGKIDAAREALKNYIEQAEELEKDVNPEERDETLRSAAAIRNTLKEIEKDIPEEDREDFVDNVIKREGEIAAAAEIAGKIKELCQTLSKLDPKKYKEICRSGEDSPKWQKELDKKLTETQRKEAKEFGKIMSECFKSSGQNCNCDEISFYDFSVACSKAAPLAVACDVDGDEKACDELDNLEMPELPDYLQDIFEEIEDQYGEDKYEMHMPKECVEAGVTSPKECGKIMIKEHAPIECRAALLEADVSSEKEGREICDKIMMKKHAPKECFEKGITDPDECAEIMDNFRGRDGPEGPRGPGGFGPPGKVCMELKDKIERLECFEKAVGDTGNHYGIGPKFDEGKGEVTWQCKENRIHWPPDCERFMREEWPEMERRREEEGDHRRKNKEDWRIKEKECAESCDLENGWWDFRDGECVCYGTGDREDREYREDNNQGEGCGDCASKCESRPEQRLKGTDCVNGRCECYYENDEPQYSEGEGPGGYEEPTDIEEDTNPESNTEEPEPESEPSAEEENSE